MTTSIPHRVPTVEEAYNRLIGIGENTVNPPDIVRLRFNELIFYENQRFRMYDDEQKASMIDSIRLNGVLNPIIVRKAKDGKYEVLSGRNRAVCSNAAGCGDDIPAIIKDVDDNQAELIVNCSNLEQRHDFLPSELAYGYKGQIEAQAKLGYSYQTSKVADENNTNRKKIFRYMRLTYLIDPLLDMVDNKRLTIKVGIELSYIKQAVQYGVFNVIAAENCRLSCQEAAQIRKYCATGKEPTLEEIKNTIVHTKKANKGLDYKKIKSFVAADDDPEETIIKALKLYYNTKG